MSDVIDDLKVQIDASTNSADAKIDKFIQKMMSLQSAISGIEMSGASQVASGINQIASSIQSFNERTKTADFSRITVGLNKLSAVDVQGVSNTAHAMESFANSINGIGNLKFDTETLNNIANSISKLGRASVTEATQNLEFLKTSMADFVSGMNNVGSLNFNPDSLYKLVSSISRLGGINATQAVKNLPQISTSLHSFVSSMNSVGGVTFNIEGLNSLVNNISHLGGAKATQATANLKPIKDQLLRFVSGLNGIGALNFDTSGLENLVSSITKLGGKSASNAIPNIQNLGISLRNLMATLSSAPRVSNNLIQITNALAKLASSGSKVSSASVAMSNGLKSYTGRTGKAMLGIKGLAASIGMFYARWWAVIRGMKGLWKATEASMDYIETLNYFDAAWGQVADAGVKNWEKSGYESAEAYAKSFSKRAQELTGKMSGFMADENGNLKSTGAVSLGIDPERLMNYQATFGQMASSMGVASETALQLSNALTMIGADLASVKNLNFKDVWEDMASGMVGMSRTLDKYGVNIRNVNLQEKLSELGIMAKVSALNQQDKALLRAIILLDSTRYAWGDLASTLDAPSNQLRLLQSNFANLARTIGNLFLPIVAKVLPYINALVIALQRLFSWVGGLLGIKVGDFSSSIGSAATDFGDMEDAADGIADSTGDAAKNTKKMADNLQGFDKLNVVSSKDSSGGKGGSGGVDGGLLDEAFLNSLSEYQKVWEAAFANVENSAQAMADKIVNAFKVGDYYGIGKYIGDGLTGALESISWSAVYSIAGGFGTGLAEFLNSLISPELFGAVGKTIAGALNTALYTALAFGIAFDWTNLGYSSANGINNFFNTFDFASAGAAVNVWAKGLLDALIEALDNINWSLIGTKIGTFLESIDFIEIGGKVGEAIWKAINAGIELWGSSFKTAPVETTMLTAFGLLKFTGLGKLLSGKIMRSLAKGLSFSGIGTLLVKAFPRSTIITTITTTMAQTGASLPSVLFGVIWVPIQTFFTTTLPGLIGGAISGLGASIAGGIAALAAALGISVTAAAALVVGVVVAAIATVVYAFTHWDEIKEFWTKKVPEWWNTSVLPFFESIPDKLSAVWDKVKSTATSSWDKLIQYLTGIPGKIGNIVTDIADWFNELPGKIGYALGYALGTITKWGLEVAEYMAKKIPEIIASVVKWFSEMPGKIYTGISTFITNVATWGTEIYNAFNQKVSEIIVGTVKWFSEMPGKIYDTIIKIKEKISTWATNTVSFFKTEVPTIVDKVIEFFGELPKKMVTIGENVIKGLWEGITNLTDWLGTGIASFTKGVIDGFKKGFDEHSPSKKAFQIGDYFTIGMMNGIEDKFGVIYSKVDSFADKLTDYNISLPSIDTNVQVSREFFDMVDTKASVSYDTPSYDFKAGISAELHAALSGIIDYEKMAKTMAPIVADALEHADIKAKIGQQEVWKSTKDSWNQDYRKLKKAPVPI
ncbi:hypothetical protein [Lacrimispora celerecrescens]|uniref:Phage-related protein n=1 Tax=[Clostridium] celerecrescens 18A TaxID=1286362 RepID=A0A2M8Z308_9FIRM|nr:hypothetical protein [Lacrimispora celerecrescens]PJJ27838.1 hypothetical protein H171_1318 [[Clostridium] celerecrescens 18A]